MQWVFFLWEKMKKNIAWFEASPRAILPVENINSGLNIPRSLKQVLNKNIFEIRIDTSFEQVIHECSKTRKHMDKQPDNECIHGFILPWICAFR